MEASSAWKWTFSKLDLKRFKYVFSLRCIFTLPQLVTIRHSFFRI